MDVTFFLDLTLIRVQSLVPIQPPLRGRRMSCRSISLLRLESSLSCSPGPPFSNSSVPLDGDRLCRPLKRNRVRRGQGRPECPLFRLFRRADSQINHMIFFMLSPTEGDGEYLVRMRIYGVCLQALVRSSSIGTTAVQEVATEVWTGRGTHAVASAIKRSKRAREAGLMS